MYWRQRSNSSADPVWNRQPSQRSCFHHLAKAIQNMSNHHLLPLVVLFPGSVLHRSDLPYPSCSPLPNEGVRVDRKSTRLNSSHVSISYAVFCLKKNTSFVMALGTKVDVAEVPYYNAHHIIGHTALVMTIRGGEMRVGCTSAIPAGALGLLSPVV